MDCRKGSLSKLMTNDNYFKTDFHLRYVLDQILSGEEPEVVVEKIHDYLTTIGEDIRSGKAHMDEFVIFKVENH